MQSAFVRRRFVGSLCHRWMIGVVLTSAMLGGFCGFNPQTNIKQQTHSDNAKALMINQPVSVHGNNDSHADTSGNAQAFVQPVSAEAGGPSVASSEQRDRLLPLFGDLPEWRLSSVDAANYSTIFDAIRKKDSKLVENLLPQLVNRHLLSHVQAQRFLTKSTAKPSASELERWLKNNADLPQAPAIYQLAVSAYGQKRLFLTPARGFRLPTNMTDPLHDNAFTTWHGRNAGKQDANGEPIIEDPLQQAVAALNAGNAKNAAKLAADYLSGKHQARALWVSGLAAWKQGQIKKAAGYFNELAENTNAPSPWISSAAAYWAARCWQRLGNPEQANKMLEQAAKTGMTFYGLLANAALGQDSGWQFSVPKLNANHLGLLATYPAGERAILLLDAGEKRLALQELKSINLRSQPQLLEPVIAIADHLQEAEWLMQLGQWAEKMRMANNKNTRAYSMAYGGAMFPIPSWKPSGGFSVNPALVYAIMRQESMFDPRAINPSSGATGLMQLMPATANWLLQMDGKKENRDIADPLINVGLGERYVKTLLNHPDVNGNLMMLAAAYNGGPGNLSRWREKTSGNDPLFFLETIPFGETRGYVERVITFYWAYQYRLGQTPSTLRDLVRDDWPLYTAAMDSGTVARAL